MILEENKTYTMKDLAAWFHLSYNTIRKAAYKERKYEELKEYADYTREGNNVTITTVHCANTLMMRLLHL